MHPLIAVCKTGASTPAGSLVSDIDMVWIGSDIVSKMFDRPAIRVDRARCINVGSHAGCMRCKEACVLGLPNPGSDFVEADNFNEQCSRCGACASECPTGAIELQDDTYGRRLSRLSLQLQQYASAEEPGGHDSLIISCGESTKDGRSGSYAGCISWLDQAAMLRLLVASNTSLQIVLGACTEVEQQKASLCISRLTRYVEASNNLLKLIGAGVRVTVSPSAVSRTSHTVSQVELMDRGTAIHEVLQRGLTMLRPNRDSCTNAQEDGFDKPSKTGRRLLAVLATRALISRAKPEKHLLFNADEESDDTESPIGVLSRKGPKINKELCTACGVCSLLCPTGALRNRKTECGSVREWRLSLDVRQCVGCAVCTKGCETPGAIRLIDRGLSGICRSKAIILVRRDCLACDTCGSEFVVSSSCGGAQSAARQCSVCSLKTLRFAGFY